MLSRVLSLNGLPIPGSNRLMVLSNSEHATNQELAIKARKQWECGDDRCRNCVSGTISISSTMSKEQEEQQDECFALYSLADADGSIPGIPRRGEFIEGVTPETYGEDDLPIYTVGPVDPPKRKRGRPKSPLTSEQRETLRQQKIKEWDLWTEQGRWSWPRLEVLKRGDLQTLASHIGISNPVSVGTNADLRFAIAELLGIE